MGLNAEQISFLIQYLGVKIPADYLRQKELEAQFNKGVAAINSEFPDFKAHHSAARVEELFNKAGHLAGRDRNFEAALETLKEMESLLRTPPPPKEPPPPPSPEPQVSKDASAAPKIQPLPVVEEPAPARPPTAEATGEPEVEGRMRKKLAAAETEFAVKRKLKEIEEPYQKAIASKSAASAKLKAHYAAAKKAASASKWKEALDFIGRIEGLLNAAAAEKAHEAKQISRAKRIGDTVGRVKNITFPKGAAEQFSKEKLKPGKEFKKFLDALKKFEKTKTRANLEAMEKAARLYIDHVGKMSEKEKRDPDRIRKKQICESQLKQASHWKLADDFEKVGPPPWDFERENKAGGIYAKMLFEEGDNPGKPLSSDEGGITAAWWVEKVTDFDYEKGSDELKKTSKKKMIFKPMDGEKEELPGFNAGMSAPREILAKVLNDQILAMTGVDAGVCPTHLVAVDNNRLAGADGKPDSTKDRERVGSVQQLAENDGALGQRIKKANDPGLMKKVSKQNFDQMVMLDMMTLNLDRHANNFLMKDNPDGTSKLIPIDHGFCFPTRESLKFTRRRLGPPQNVLMEFPQANEPFSPEALQSIDMLDPDAIAAAMRDAAKAMEKSTPEAKGTISDESIEISRRSAIFMKRAARELTPAEMAAAQVHHQDKLLDAPPNKLDQAIDEIIAAIKKRRAELENSKNLISFPADEKVIDDYYRNLKALGWDIEKKLLPRLFSADPGRFTRILRGRIVHPTAQKKLDARIKALGAAAPLPPGFDDLPVLERIAWLDSKLRELKKNSPADADKDNRPAELAAPAAKKLLAKYPKAKLAQLARFFTNFQSSEEEERTQAEIEKELAEALSWYELFEKEGGFDEAARLDVDLGIPVEAAVNDLRDAKKLEAAFKVTGGMTDEGAQKQQRAFVQKLIDSCRNDIAQILIPDVKSQLQSQLKASSDAAGAADFDRAQAILEPLRRRVQTQLADEAGKIKAAREAWTKFEAEYKKVPDGPGIKAYRDKYAEELKGVEPLIAAAKFNETSKRVKFLTNELDRAINGANSRIAQIEKAHTEAIDMVKGISSAPHVASTLKLAAEYRDGGDLQSYWGQVSLLQNYAADAALKPVRDVLEAKKSVNKDASTDFSKKHKDYLEAGLLSKLQEQKVNINTLLASVPALMSEVQAIR